MTMLPTVETGTIYVIRNTVNKKLYIGCTVQPLAKRFNGHKHLAKNTVFGYSQFYDDMKRYGFDKFYIKPLHENVPIEDLGFTEDFYINLLDTINTGYNKAVGGGAVQRIRPSLEYLLDNAYRSCSDIGKELKAKRSTVENMYKDYGTSKSEAYKLYLQRVEEYILETKDYSYESIADKFHISTSTVNRLIHNMKDTGKLPKIYLKSVS